MIAVLISDLGAWLAKGSRLTLVIIIGLLTITAGITCFRPEALTEAFTLVIVWVGLYTGEERWGNPEVWQWVSHGELTPFRVMISKATVVALLLLLLVIVILPVLVISEMIWGVPINRLWMTVLIWLMTVETSLAIGITSHYFRDQNPYFGSIVLVGWIVATAIVPGLNPLNPFIRVWKVISSVDPDDPGIYFIANLSFVVAMLTTVGWRLRKEVNWRLGQQIHH